MRLFFPYGPGENPNRLIPHTILSLLSEKAVTCSNPSSERDFVFVDDVAEILANLTNSSTDGLINIGTGQPTAIGSFISAIADSLGKRHLINLDHDNVQSEDKSIFFADLERLRQAMPNHKFTSLEHGIDKTISWWRSQK
jgi:nucleoside-diphosphate-sugar epimerase